MDARLEAVLTTSARWWRRVDGWRTWLRQQGAQAALIIVLVVSMLEPFGCLMYCQLWLSTSTHHTAPTAHAHHHGGDQRGQSMHHSTVSETAHGHGAQQPTTLDDIVSAGDLSASVPASIQPAASAISASCFVSGGSETTPIPGESASPPLHDHFAALIALSLLSLAVLVRLLLLAPPLPPPLTAPPRLLRPPILSRI